MRRGSDAASFKSPPRKFRYYRYKLTAGLQGGWRLAIKGGPLQSSPCQTFRARVLLAAMLSAGCASSGLGLVDPLARSNNASSVKGVPPQTAAASSNSPDRGSAMPAVDSLSPSRLQMVASFTCGNAASGRLESGRREPQQTARSCARGRFGGNRPAKCDAGRSDHFAGRHSNRLSHAAPLARVSRGHS